MDIRIDWAGGDVPHRTAEGLLKLLCLWSVHVSERPDELGEGSYMSDGLSHRHPLLSLSQSQARQHPQGLKESARKFETQRHGQRQTIQYHASRGLAVLSLSQLSNEP